MEDRQRPATRSQGYLGIPAAFGFGRGRSPSSSPTDRSPGPVFFPPTAMAPTGEQQTLPFDMAEIHRIAAAAAAEAAAAAVAAAFAAQAANTRTVSTDGPRKRPDLPKFDAKNIDIWIRRTEAAYCRAAVTTATDKFAFLESLFDVGFNPKIDEFLYGAATDARWTAFLAYLRKEYGRTQQQKAASVLDGINREGRRPTQLLAHMDSQIDDVTIDEIKKEMLLRQLPRQVRHALSGMIKTATAAQLAEQADDYFDREGTPLNSESPANVNHVSKDNQDDVIEAEQQGDVNATLGGQPRGRSSFRPRQPPQPQGSSNRGSSARSRSRPRLVDGECFYHQKFKDQALKCQPGCKHQGTFSSGNGQAGRRT